MTRQLEASTLATGVGRHLERGADAGSPGCSPVGGGGGKPNPYSPPGARW